MSNEYVSVRVLGEVKDVNIFQNFRDRDHRDYNPSDHPIVDVQLPAAPGSPWQGYPCLCLGKPWVLNFYIIAYWDGLPMTNYQSTMYV